MIVAADANARDDETRQIAQSLRDALTRRVEAEHATWLNELSSTLREGRIVRALRLSSRPPKAGAPLPSELSTQLIDQTTAALTAETAQDRWITVLDALSFSPVRAAVTPPSRPAEVSDDLRSALGKLVDRLPHIAALLEVEAVPVKRRTRKSGTGVGTATAATKAPPIPAPPVLEAPPAEEPSSEVPSSEVPSPEVPSSEVPSSEVPSSEVPSPELPSSEEPSAEEPAEG